MKPWYYLESSALAKRYLNESGSPWVLALTRPEVANRLCVADVTHVEVTSAVRRRQLTAGVAAAAALKSVLADVHDDFDRQYLVTELTPGLVRRAVVLAQAHALRGVDALQLSVALWVRDEAQLLGVPFILVSADGELNAAAQSEGLKVENPEDHP